MTASLLGTDIDTGQLVTLEQEQRLKGLYVIGKTGTGKTTLLVNMILQDIEQGMGLCFISPHADAFTDILKRLPSDREQDVLLIDPMDKTHAFGLNLLYCTDPTNNEEVSRVISSVIEVFAKLFTESGDIMKEAPNMAETLQMALPVLLAHQSPPMTIAEIPLLTMDATARTKLLAPVAHPAVKGFWQDYHTWSKKEQIDLTSSTRKRVNDFLINPFTFEIIGQNKKTLQFREIMDTRKILFVKLPRKPELIASLIGSVIVMQIANTAFSREDTPEDQRIQFNLYADEYQRFSTPTFAELLTEVRKYKIATTVAHQARGQIDYANKVATLNANTLVVYQVSGEDAEDLAKEFDHSPIPGEKVLKPVTRPIMTTIREEVWNPPEAEAKCKVTVEDLQRLQEYAHLLLGFRTESKAHRTRQVETREQKNHYPYDRQVRPDPLFRIDSYNYHFKYPIGWIGVLEAQREGYYKVGNYQYHLDLLDLPPQKPTTLITPIGWVHDETQEQFSEFRITRKCQPAWGHKKVQEYLLTNVYQSLQVFDYSDGHDDKYVPIKTVKDLEAITHYSLDGHNSIKITLKQPRMLAYRFPADLPSLWEAEIEAKIEDISTGKSYAYFNDTSLYLGYINSCQQFLEDLHRVLTPLKARVVYYCDPKETSKPRTSEPSLWKEVPFPEVKLWVDQKVAELIEKGDRLQAEYDELIKCKSVEVRTVETGRYEPVYQYIYSGHSEERIPLQEYVDGNEVSSSEVESRIANILANPKQPFTARAKLGTQEHTILALPFRQPDLDSVWMARRDRIIENTHQLYCRERTTVRDEIKQRQDALMKKAPLKPRTTSDDDEE